MTMRTPSYAETRQMRASLIAWAHTAERLASSPDVALWLQRSFHQSAFDARRLAEGLSREAEPGWEGGDENPT
jgi:hypothetical protein